MTKSFHYWWAFVVNVSNCLYLLQYFHRVKLCELLLRGSGILPQQIFWMSSLQSLVFACVSPVYVVRICGMFQSPWNWMADERFIYSSSPWWCAAKICVKLSYKTLNSDRFIFCLQVAITAAATSAKASVKRGTNFNRDQ